VVIEETPGEAMTDARLTVDTSSISFRASGPATGDVVLVLGNVVFPVAGWNDFVVVILAAWLGALVRLLGSTNETERIHFMEGPYAVDVTRIDDHHLRLRAFERPNRECACMDVRVRPLVDSALFVIEAVLQVCKERNHRSGDVEALEVALAALRKEASMPAS